MNTSLKVIQNAGTRLSGCGGPDHCAKCELFGKVCPGSRGRCGAKKQCAQRECFGECNTCGGGPSAPGSAPAICCKSPLKDIFLAEVRGSLPVGREVYEYAKRPKIVLSTKGIVVTQGSVGSAFGTGYAFAPEIEAVGVNLRHVWAARNGWWSRDMRDYLRVPKTTKLILFTSGYDDTLEKAWDSNMFEEDYTRVGFDYWQNLSFSMYAEDSPMQTYFSSLRSLRSVSASRSWFAEDLPVDHLRPEWVAARLREQVAAIPQIILNMQFMSTDKSDILAHAVGVKRLHRDLPLHVSFWIHGPVRPWIIKLLKNICFKRDLYFMSSGPWIAGHKGQLLRTDGRMITEPKFTRREIVWENQRMYARLCA